MLIFFTVNQILILSICNLFFNFGIFQTKIGFSAVALFKWYFGYVIL